MSQFNLPLVADGLTAYAIERQHEFQSHQRQDILLRMALLESCMDSIFQGMARLDGRTPTSDLMRQVSKRLEEAAGCSAVKTLPLKEQTALIRELSRYVSALEATGGGRFPK